ncbi:MAG TPA: MlaD family protein [Stellaceae bacterium]|nr:MlaD family protein [Stellaceae bacterium]
METRAHYVAVGAFVLAMILLAFVAVLWLGRVQLSQELARYYVFFKGSVNGLSKGAAVQYNGIPVGRVVDVRVDRENIEQIQVAAEIDENLVTIKSDARAYLETNILSGVSTVQIRGGTKEAAVLTARPGHKYPVIPAGESSFQRVSATAPQLLDHILRVADNLNRLLNRRNRQALSDTLANTDILTARLARRAEELHEVIANADGATKQLDTLLRHVDESYAGQNGLKDQASQLLAGYTKLAKNLDDTNRQIQAVIAENRPGVRQFTSHTLGEADRLLADARRLVAGLESATSEIKRNPSRILFGDRREGYKPR